MLTLNEICEKLAISRYTARAIIDAGELKAIKVNGRYRIHPNWLDEYIENAAATA